MTSCKVYSYPNKQINSICFSLLCCDGAMTEKANEKGLTHLLEHLCFRKAGDLSQSQIYTLLESNGVNLNGRTGKNYVELQFKCRPDVFDTIAKLVSKMWFEMDYSQEDLDLEKKVVCSEIYLKEKSNSQTIRNKRWRNSLLDCTILGDIQSVDDLTLQQVVNRKKALLSTDTIILIAGNVSQENFAIVQREFADRFVPAEQNKLPAVLREDSSQVLNMVKDRYSDVDVYYSFHATIGNDEDKYFAMCALESILLMGNCGYFVETLREKFGLVYEVDSDVEMVEGEINFLIKLSCDKKHITDLVSQMEKLVRNFIVTDKYLQYVRAFYCDNLPIILDDPESVCDCVTNGIVAINSIIAPQHFSFMCQQLDPHFCQQIFDELKINKQVYLFGNISRCLSKEIRKLIS